MVTLSIKSCLLGRKFSHFMWFLDFNDGKKISVHLDGASPSFKKILQLCNCTVVNVYSLHIWLVPPIKERNTTFYVHVDSFTNEDEAVKNSHCDLIISEIKGIVIKCAVGRCTCQAWKLLCVLFLQLKYTHQERALFEFFWTCWNMYRRQTFSSPR